MVSLVSSNPRARKIERAFARERPAVVDAHDHGASVMADAQPRAEGKPGMRGGEAVRIEAFAGGRAFAAVLAAVPGGDARARRRRGTPDVRAVGRGGGRLRARIHNERREQGGAETTGLTQFTNSVFQTPTHEFVFVQPDWPNGRRMWPKNGHARAQSRNCAAPPATFFQGLRCKAFTRAASCATALSRAR